MRRTTSHRRDYTSPHHFSKLEISAPFSTSIICARQFPKTNLLKRRKSKGIIFWNLTSPRETGRSKTPKPVLVKRRKPQNAASRKLVAAQVSNSKELRNPRASSQPLGQLLLSESGGNGQIIVQYFEDLTLRRVLTHSIYRVMASLQSMK